MKDIVKILIAIALIVGVAAGVEAKKKKGADGKAQMKFTEYVYDFGDIKEADGPVSHDFKFTNTGLGNLVILDATAECGCTRPDYPKNPIAPAKSGKVKVVYLPAGRPGPFDKQVTIRTNGDPKKVRIKIKGNVIPK